MFLFFIPVILMLLSWVNLTPGIAPGVRFTDRLANYWGSSASYRLVREIPRKTRCKTVCFYAPGYTARYARWRLFKQIMMQLLHHLFGVLSRHKKAQVVAGSAVTNHTDIERFQYAEYLFADAAGF